MTSWPDFNYKQLIVHLAGESGERLRFRCDNIVIEDPSGKVLFQHSCHRTFALMILGEITVTSVLLKQCRAYGFPLILLGRNLRPVATIHCPAEGNTLLRRRQYDLDEAARLAIAKELVDQKIANQIRLLQDLRHLAREDRETLAQLAYLRPREAPDAHALMGVEGTASRLFFSTYFRVLGWRRREPRCKPDIPNLLLDIGYTYLFHFISTLLSLYGFDLYCGVLHTFFYQRMSLVCDLVEPFRCIIDRRVRKAHNLGQIDPADFFQRGGAWNLRHDRQSKYAGLFLKDILQQKEPLFRYCQHYYRWLMRRKSASEFPRYRIGE